MRRATFAAVSIFILAAHAGALDVPFLSGRVNDYAHLLDGGTASALETKLKGYETRTGGQFAVLTIPSLEGAPLEEYSLKVARTWKLGRAGKDDGVLLLVSRDDHKLRIEVGYGLEGVLPDALCGRIIRDAIVPRFRGGDYAGGVTAGVDAALAALSGSGSPPSPPSWSSGLFTGRKNIDFLGVLMELLFLWLMIHAAFETAFGSSPGMGLIQFLTMDLLFSVTAADWWGYGIGVPLLIASLFLLAAAKWAAANTDWGREMAKDAKRKGTTMYWLSTPSSSSGGGSSGGGYSGGGGSFGGGGSSGSW
jgi:uncharacterized protein